MEPQKKEENKFGENKPQFQNGGNSLNKPIQQNPLNSNKNVKFLEPEVIEKTNWELKHAGFAIIFAFVLVLIHFGLIIGLEIEPTSQWILAFVLIVIYGSVIYFLLEPKREREVRQRIVETDFKTIEKPIEKTIYKTVEVEKPVIKEMPIIKEVPVYKEIKDVYVAKSINKKTKRKEKIDYPYVGSKLTKVYHKASCRIAKSIEKKNLVKGKTKEFFRKQGYRPCGICMK